MHLFRRFITAAVQALVRWGRREAAVPPRAFKVNQIH
jgi:uncharacterized membrane protein YagU involved in acid resistance